jgi:hypothetical protein
VKFGQALTRAGRTLDIRVFFSLPNIWESLAQPFWLGQCRFSGQAQAIGHNFIQCAVRSLLFSFKGLERIQIFLKNFFTGGGGVIIKESLY